MQARLIPTRSIWWMNPAKYLLFFLLPIFLVACILGPPLMPMFGQLNYIDFEKIMLGAAAIAALAIGSGAGQFATKSVAKGRVPLRSHTEIVLLGLLGTSVLMHLILMNQLFLDRETFISIITGQPGAVFRFRNNAARIPGITSFTQVYVIAFPLMGAYKALYGKRWSKAVSLTALTLVMLMFLRAFTLAERLILVEAIILFAVPRLMLSDFRGTLVNLFPVLGFVGIFVLFAAGEYIRSWHFYEDSYDSYLEFVVLRMSGYVITATNTGAGILERIGTTGYPYVTALWFWRLPFIELAGFEATSPISKFLQNYGNAEFNNPSGIFAAIIDFGTVAGLLVYFLLGLVAGWLYRRFTIGNIIAIVIFPIMFMALLELTQVFYLGDPRLFTSYALLPPILWFLIKGSTASDVSAHEGYRRPSFKSMRVV